MKLTKRQWSLGGLLVATLAAVAWVTSGNDPEPTQLAATAKAGATRHARTEHSDAVIGSVEPQRLIRVVGERKVGDPFGATSFQPPPAAPPKPAITVAAPPPPVTPVAAPAPTAPPFPWTFMGRMIEDPQNPAVFLSRGDRLTVAHLGETLESSWKVVGMDARGLRVEYLPLKSSHTVAMPIGNDTSGSVSGVTVAAQAAQAAAQAAVAQQNMALQIQPAAEGTGAADARPAAPAPASGQPSPVSGIEISNGFGAAQAPR